MAFLWPRKGNKLNCSDQNKNYPELLSFLPNYSHFFQIPKASHTQSIRKYVASVSKQLSFGNRISCTNYHHLLTLCKVGKECCSSMFESVRISLVMQRHPKHHMSFCGFTIH